MIKILKNSPRSIISTVERTSNVAKVVTTLNHDYAVNDLVVVDAVDNLYDVSLVVITSVPAANSFTYSNSGSDGGAKADAGTIAKRRTYRG